MKKVSVVLTTYNGEQFVIELLDSIRLQTRKADEVLISDDNSRDNTVSLIRNYIKENQLNNFKLLVNQKNLGWQENFKKTMLMATGDVIFFADQDDIWHKDKIEKQLEVFEKYDAKLVVSDFNPFGVFSEKEIFSGKLDTDVLENSIEKIRFNKCYYQIMRPGCTMAFSSILLKDFEKIWEKDTPHDALIWVIAGLYNSIYYYHENLIEYRRCGNNASIKMTHEIKYKINEVERTEAANNIFIKEKKLDPSQVEVVNEINMWCHYRKELLLKKKVVAWIRLWKYMGCYLSPKKYFGDLYYFIAG